MALHYVDSDGNVTMEYPMNPNGSEGAVVITMYEIIHFYTTVYNIQSFEKRVLNQHFIM